MNTLAILTICFSIVLFLTFFVALYFFNKEIKQKQFSYLFIIVLSSTYVAWQIFVFLETGNLQNRIFGWIVFAVLVSVIILKLKKLKSLKEN